MKGKDHLLWAKERGSSLCGCSGSHAENFARTGRVAHLLGSIRGSGRRIPSCWERDKARRARGPGSRSRSPPETARFLMIGPVARRTADGGLERNSPTKMVVAIIRPFRRDEVREGL